MSISSCPSCSKHVTLPEGASNDTQVRCPLCHAQYTLADALANAPPVLEVIQEPSVATDWLDNALQAPSPKTDVPPMEELAVEFQPLEAFDEPASPEAADLAPDEAELMSSKSPAIEHDDFLMQEKDTEIEDFSSTPDPLAGRATVEFEPVNITETTGDLGFEFGRPPDDSELPTLDAGADREGPDDDLAIDFGDPQPEFQEATDDGGALDFGEPVEGTGEAATIDFEYQAASTSPSADDDLVPDFGEPMAASAVPMGEKSAGAEPDGKSTSKKKKDKTKKAAKAKTDAGPARKKSALSTIGGIVLPGLITVPLALYALLWLGPDYDFFNIGRSLPSAMVPAAFNKPKTVAVAPIQIDVGQLEKAATAFLERQSQKPASAPDAPPEESAAPQGDTTDTAGEAAASPADTADSQTDASPAEPAADKTPAADTASDDAVDDAKDNPAAGPALTPKQPAVEDTADMPDKPDSADAADAPSDLDSLLNDTKPAGKPADEPAELAEAIGPVDAPKFKAEDLTKALHDVGAANKKMMAAQAAKDDAELKKARKDFYLNLFELGQVTTFANDDAKAQRKGVEQVAAQFAADPKRLDALKTNAARWFVFSKRTTPGIALAGEVQTVEEVGKLFHVNVRVGDVPDAPVVTVVCEKDPQLEPNDQILTLGSIIAHPELELVGYGGSDTAVVWNGMTVKISADSK